MTNLTLKNYTTSLPAQTLKLAEKNIVRECDEVEKGSYIAFVDEGEASYDVSLVVSKNSEIIKADCDCKNNQQFCRHKTALLLFIAGAKKEKKPRTLKAKINRADAVLDDVAFHDLKAWVKTVLEKNPDIELSFLHYFSNPQQEFTEAEIIKLTNNAVKAVVKNKKNIDPTQLKKILELWETVHQPVLKRYQAGIADENAFKYFDVLLTSCLQNHYKLQVNGKKILGYIDQMLKTCVETTASLENESSFYEATTHIINNLVGEKEDIRFYYIDHIAHILNLSSADRIGYLVNKVATKFANYDTKLMADGARFTQKVFELVEQHNLFKNHFTIFLPVYWGNDYNLKLIAKLIDIQQYSLAEQYAKEQVASNYREEYNILYWQLLQTIYLITKNNEGVAEMRILLFPYTFNFEDYLLITAAIKDEAERNKWRTKMLTKARNSRSDCSAAAISFYFQLASYEKRYQKMIEYIDAYTPYGIILQYFEPMWLTNKTLLLIAILSKPDRSPWHFTKRSEEHTDQVFPALLQIMIKHYTEGYLKSIIVSRQRGSSGFEPKNDFTEYAMKELDITKK